MTPGSEHCRFDITPEIWMQRCLQLAQQGAGYVAPNPMVGAVLVYKERIIGEGYHQHYGKAHAEVNCIVSVKDEDLPLIAESTMYVSLEPCAHFGKTPPCADLIIKYKIPRVVIGCRDPFKEVDGRGIEKLEQAGVEVIQNVFENECRQLNKRFFTYHTMHRPYIILKWAQTGNGMISSADNKRLLISNEYSNRLVHGWRSEEAGILIGTNTALLDDPELTTRLWPGPSPVRLVIDMNLRLPSSLKIFNGETQTIIFNAIKQEKKKNLQYYQIKKDTSVVTQVVHALYQLNIQSIIVEGGGQLLQSFIDERIWDEARVITNRSMIPGEGVRAPELEDAERREEVRLGEDFIDIYRRLVNKK